jgi:pimeloyl-ACP methyl ester carboxylesterase
LHRPTSEGGVDLQTEPEALPPNDTIGWPPGAILRRVRTTMLDMACLDLGPQDGTPVLLLHGFPYDVLAFHEIAPMLASSGCRVLVPYLRGFGSTHFLRDDIPRSGEQAAIARDVRDLIDVLALDQPILAGFDWGGRAACIVAALWPDRLRALVTCGGYTILRLPNPDAIVPPSLEHALWYQHAFARPGAHRRLAAQRDEFCRYLWQIWSPSWRIEDTQFEATARSFANPDFVNVVIHAYRHRLGFVTGDPALADIADRAAKRPSITVPTIALFGDRGITPVPAIDREERFVGWSRRVILSGIGHNVPQEAPRALIAAITDLIWHTTGERETTARNHFSPGLHGQAE